MATIPQGGDKISRKPGRPFNSFEGGSLSRGIALSSALEIVSAKTLSGLTIQALAKSLNISRAPIYTLFSSRQKLVEEVIDSVLSKIFLEDSAKHPDWRAALRQFAERAFKIYRTYPGTASHLAQTGFPDTDAGRRSSRKLAMLMHEAGAPAQLIPTLIFASTAMITGADLEFSGQLSRDVQSKKSKKEKEKIERRRGKTLPQDEFDMAMFLAANEVILLGIEASINKNREKV